jgi:hypothetical protein
MAEYDGLKSSPPLYIYLDLNHWYTLGRAIDGEGDASSLEVYARLRDFVEGGRIQLPLSSIHYMELTENPNDKQRRQAGLAMRELSRFVTMTPLTKVVREEMRASFYKRFGRPFRQPVPKFGVGAGFAFDEPDFVLFKDRTDEQLAELERRTGLSISELRARFQERAEYMLLVGPNGELRQQLEGYDPYAARRMADEELKSFNIMVETLRTDPDISQRPQDAIWARELVHDVYDAYLETCLAGGFISNQPFRDKDGFSDFLLSLPTARVSIMMKSHYLKDVQRDWKINDFRDIYALSLAIPYCDVAVTDKKAWDVTVNRAHLDEAFGTRIFCKLGELVEYLDGVG